VTGERSPFDSSRWPEGTEVISAPVDDFYLALDVLETVFPDLSRTFFHSLIARDPEYNPGYSLAVQQDRRYLSFLQIFRRKLSLDRESIEFGGIGSVATRPESRKQGYASALLERAGDMMRHEGMSGALLFTSIHPFYERLGWNIVRQFEWDLSTENLVKKPFRLEWLRPMREDDFAALHHCYIRMQERMGGGVLRTDAYWRARASWLTHFPVILQEGNEILGYFYYAQYDLKKPVMTVSEFGYNEPETWALERLVRAMARKAEELGCGTMRGFFHLDPFMRLFCESRNLVTGKQDFHYAMWKDLSGQPRLSEFQDHADRNRLLLWTTDAF
jgi:GNAT superfamily N-acetyltransferase